ncbi:UDP-N-acetylmuramyl pentapeptide phosphotransferase [Candidatus Terasakiella magnetica]|nr:UDP-N-acetylmuramyl pentapeptide phosphotransferase [Candidatus Terasakiella magnetica]
MSLAIGMAALAFLLSAAGTRAALGWLRHKQILDHPNERSSHVHPTPRGGGLAVTPVLVLCWAVIASLSPGPVSGWALIAVAGALLLLATSWMDDRHTLAAGPRLLVHLGVAAGVSLALPAQALVFQGLLPLWADRVLTVLGWVWFLNLYNFMDGIDGITGVETASIGLGIALVAAVGGGAIAGLEPYALTAMAVGAGFLVWNWPPARIFLGDSGSVPLGFLLGGLLILLAGQGQLAAALILPGYYLADATITLLWRLKDGEKIWQAHRRHFYQRAVKGGKTHAEVTRAILAANAALIACACLGAIGHGGAAGLAAVVVVAVLLALMTRWAKAGPA